MLEGFSLEAPKTKAVAEMLHAIGAEGGAESPVITKVLLVLGSHNEVLERSAHPVPERGDAPVVERLDHLRCERREPDAARLPRASRPTRGAATPPRRSR